MVTFNEDPVGICFLSIAKNLIYSQRFTLSNPTRALILRLSELGHLYVRVSKWVREHDGRPGVGMIEQVRIPSNSNRRSHMPSRVFVTISKLN